MPKKPNPVPKPLPDPKAVFDHATRFLATDIELRKLLDKDPDLAEFFYFPGMVISAFASELHLKCLLLIEGKTPPRSHNLKVLYDKLTADTKTNIEAEYAIMSRKTAAQVIKLEKTIGRSIPKDLSTALSDCGSAFELMRYIYEQPKGTTFYITHLPLVLHKVILRITKWK